MNLERTLHGLLLCMMLLTMRAAALEAGYVSPLSVSQGDTVRFYISTGVSPFTLTIYRMGNDHRQMATIDGLTGGVQWMPDSSFYYGCRWKATAAFIIPSWWTSGVYSGEFPTSTGSQGCLFVVREKNPGSTSRMVVLLSSNTWQAYNNVGGKSLYDFNSTNTRRSSRVSFNRPMFTNWGNVDYFLWADKLIRWMDRVGYKAEFITDADLDGNSYPLNAYDLFVIVGHNEYWTLPMRRRLETFLAAGKNLAILGGNTCWWQARYDQSSKMLTCFKDGSADPMHGWKDSLVTVNWRDWPVYNPENPLTGLSSFNGGYVTDDIHLPQSKGYGDYAALNTAHWVFDGTGLKDGTEFGYNADIAGYESDGAAFQWNDGMPQVTGADGSPWNYTILAISPTERFADNSRGHATMGLFQTTAGGWVFNAASTNWANGLDNTWPVQKITQNVLDRFLSGSVPPQILSWTPSRARWATINNDPCCLNVRDTSMTFGQPLTFTVSAFDVNVSALQYLWKVNDIVVEGDSTFVLDDSFPLKENNTVTAMVYNGRDTAAISWNVQYTDGFNLGGQAGWNLISLPINTGNIPLMSCFRDLAGAYDFSSGTYTKIDSISGAVSFWVQLPQAETVAVWGKRIFSTDIPIQPGWNLIPSLGVASPVTAVSTTPAGILQSGFYEFGNGYRLVRHCLRAGLGYWIKSSQTGTLHLVTDGYVANPGESGADTAYNTLIIRDASGRSQKLYFGVPQGNNTALDMPPQTPSGAFDVRFAGDRMGAFSQPGSKERFDVIVTSAQYPLTAEWHVNQPVAGTRLQYGAGSAWLGTDGTCTIAAGQNITLYFSDVLAVRQTNNAVPLVFDLKQNYPNPFNPVTTIPFTLPGRAQVSISVFDILGREIARPADGASMEAGEHAVEYAAGMEPSGIYYYRLIARLLDGSGVLSQQRKMALIR